MSGLGSLLITGGSGQVGGAVARLAVERGLAAYAPPREVLDLSDPASIARVFAQNDWRAIVNCGAYTAVDRAESEPELAQAINAEAPALLAKLAAGRGIPMVQVSTDYVFSGAKSAPYVETDPIAPVGVYGKTKATGEAAVRAAAPASHAIVRTAWVLSADGTNFLNTMLRLARDRSELGVVADQIGSPTAATDLAKAIILMIERNAVTGQTWHVVNSGSASWFELAEHIFTRAKQAGLKVPNLRRLTTDEYPTPARRPANSRLATAKVEADLGISFRPWQKAVDSILHERLQLPE